MLVDKSVDINSLLLGDKEAILIYTRIYGIGTDYTCSVLCNACKNIKDYDFKHSIITECMINDKNCEKLKYQSILQQIYNLINDGTKIIKNTKRSLCRFPIT